MMIQVWGDGEDNYSVLLFGNLAGDEIVVFTILFLVY